MNSPRAELQITWNDPRTRLSRCFTGMTPITIGRDYTNCIVLTHLYVALRHARLDYYGGELTVSNERGRFGLRVNGREVERAVLKPGDRLAIGPYSFRVAQAEGAELPRYELRGEEPLGLAQLTEAGEFPPACFDQTAVPLWALRRAGLPIDEIDYLTVGGALASFAWVERLHRAGVPAAKIVALGLDAKPYGRYERMLSSGQLAGRSVPCSPGGARASTRNRPGYGSRPDWRDLVAGEIDDPARFARELLGGEGSTTLQIRAADLFATIEQVAERIKWRSIWRYGQVRAIRKTADGRYVAAYTQATEGQPPQHRLIVARHVHLAVGFPGVRLMPDLTIHDAFRTIELARSALMQDLVEQYRPELGPDGRIIVTPEGELASMRNGSGRMYVVGGALRGSLEQGAPSRRYAERHLWFWWL